MSSGQTVTQVKPTRPLQVVRVPCLEDNYGWVVHCEDTGHTAVIDTPEREPLLAACRSRGWKLTHVLNTHHHWDHVGNNLALKEETGCAIVGPEADRERIPGLDLGVEDGDTLYLGRHAARVFFTPGHTRGHIVYWFEEDKALFCGDTLFALGCGRLFEGTPAQLWSSLSRLRELPDDTRVYCAHEYTLSNAAFALTLESGNEALQQRAAAVRQARERGQPTVPFLLGEDKATNPFLRADVSAVQRAVGLEGGDPAEVFGEVRARKDVFRG